MNEICTQYGLSLGRLKGQAALKGIPEAEVMRVAMRLYDKRYISYFYSSSTGLPLIEHKEVSDVIATVTQVVPSLTATVDRLGLSGELKGISAFFVNPFQDPHHAIVPLRGQSSKKLLEEVDPLAPKLYAIIAEAYLYAVARG